MVGIPEVSDDEVSEDTSDVFPRTAEEVCRMGKLFLQDRSMFVEDRCDGCSILLYNHIHSYKFERTFIHNGSKGLDGEDGTNGEKGCNGGSGGNGGDGGLGGNVTISIPGMEFVLKKRGGRGGASGQGGQGGKGGRGGAGGEGYPGQLGSKQTKTWTADKRYSDNFLCAGCRNTLEESNLTFDNLVMTGHEQEPCCQGPRGQQGRQGDNGEDGMPGKDGKPGRDGTDSF